MATEVELKLAVPPRVLRDATQLPWLHRLASGPVSREKLVSVYFDTGNFKLRDHGVSLRIRRMGRKRLQTIKAAANGAASGRREWEVEVATEKPDLKLAKGTALAPLVTRKLKRSLRPVFETDVERIAVPLRVGSSDLELAFDRGRIRTGGRSEPVSEIELELKQGNRADLARLAERFARSIAATYGPQPKAERGYALSAGKQDKPVEAYEIVLARTVSTGEAFAAIGLSCLNHVAANAGAVRRGEPEGVHQMRVGLRRLRASVSVFKEVARDTDTEKIKSELKWLGEQLAAARDFDVFVQEGVAPLRKENPEQRREIALLEADLAKKRDAGFEKAKAAATGERYRRIVLRTALWLINGEWSRNADALMAARRDRPVSAFARDVLRRRTKNIAKKVRKLERLGVEDRHRLRIAVKKLRYATDFFASLAGSKVKKARKRFEKELKALQDALGKLNDIAVHEKLAKQFARPAKPSKKLPEKAFAMGLLTGREKHEARACIAAAMKAGRNLSGARLFLR
jgi:triphosphatase